MQLFKELYIKLDQTQSTNEKVEFLKNYFLQAPPSDAAWALFFLTGNRLKRVVSSLDLSQWCSEYLQMPDWLFLESYGAVGDTAEVVSLLLESPQTDKIKLSLSEVIENHILPLQNKSKEEKKSVVLDFWKKLDRKSCFVFNKLLTGAFRVGASRQLTIRGLSQALDIPQELLVQSIINNTNPSAEFFESLKNLKNVSTLPSSPFPFYLASPLEDDLKTLGDPKEWLAEWKWDGIRAQLVIHQGTVLLWSRGNEVITNQSPEIVAEVSSWNKSVILDGEILAFENGKPLPFFSLQKRLGRQNPSKKIQSEIPLIFMAYDLLSYQGIDIRKNSLLHRREKLIEIITEHQSKKILLSPAVSFETWDELDLIQKTAKDMFAEGVMLKKWSEPYRSGRVRGFWWKHKVDPMTIDAVLIYAQPGSGRRANLYTDYTFAVWSENSELVPIAKAYSGLDQAEINELDKWIRKHTLEKFGPVRQVEPFHVFEIAFENIQPSTRHKSGVALRFPRILRWRKDKTANEADRLEEIKKLIVL